MDEQEEDKETLNKIKKICDDLDKNNVNKIDFKNYRLRNKNTFGGQGKVLKTKIKRNYMQPINLWIFHLTLFHVILLYGGHFFHRTLFFSFHFFFFFFFFFFF